MALGSAILILASVGAIILLTEAPAQESGRFFVEGARPTREAGKTYFGTEGCVPFSAERPDTMICGDVPEGFHPGRAPGTEDSYPDICQQAEEVYLTQRDEMNWGPVNFSDCQVIPTSTYPGKDPAQTDYFVVFGALVDGAEDVSIALNLE